MIEIQKASKQNKNYTYKILISFFIFSIIVLATIIIVHMEFSKENTIKKFSKESHLQSKEKTIFLESFLTKRVDSLLAIRDNPYFREFVETGMYQHNTDFLFYTIMQENKEYMQLRFIDKNGYESIRFDRKTYGEVAYKVLSLQDKKQRYYFKNTINLKDNSIFFSKIDFNMEKGKVQIPYTPVLRVATPVYINKKLKGILIINIFVKKFIQLLTSSPIYNISIVDENGYFIKKLDMYYSRTKHINKVYDMEVVKSILNTKDNSIIADKNIFIKKMDLGTQTNFMIFESKNEMLKQIRQSDIKMTLIILAITILISIPFALLLTRPIKDMFELIIHQSDKLHDLALTLDKKVQIETLKNAKKDRLLQHQSKMAELGDMIGNIAHQWRHPITRLSLLLQNLKLYKSKNKLTDEIFFESLQKVNEQIEFMSETIDNFKNFYKTDKQKDTFKIKDSLDDVLKIIGTILDHNNITMIICDEDNIEIYGIKNQFSQVLLNLIVNAKDALLSNNIKDPKINIKISQDEKGKYITIADNAGGIEKNIIDDIFDPYFTTKKEKGTGIGLYLCKTIIEDDMKGQLKVTNIKDGALFKISILK